MPKGKGRAVKMIEIQIAHLTKGLVSIRVKNNSTVSEVLDAQGIKAEDVYLNGRKVAKSTKVKAKDIIGVVARVDGGQIE